MKCHNEKVADVCTTEYKDTTVGQLDQKDSMSAVSTMYNFFMEKVKKCKPVEKLESQRVCQKVPRRVCRQVTSKKIPPRAVSKSWLTDSHILLTLAKNY